MSGINFDDGKPAWHLLPADALEQVVIVLTAGAQKHGAGNWEQGMSWSHHFSACMRHMWKWWRGEDKDDETGSSNLAHAICRILFLLAYVLRRAGDDDRN